MPATTNDEPRTPLAITLAIGLHALLVLVLLAYFWLVRKPVMAASEHVFELVSAPSDTPAEAAPAEHTTPTPSVHAPTMPPLAKMPPLPKTPPTPPTPTPPTPTPPTPAQASPTPPLPVTKAPSTMSYADFIKAHPLAAATPATKPSHAATRTAPQITLNATAEEQALQSLADSATGKQTHTAKASSAEMSDYNDKVIARLRDAYEKPAELLDAGLVAGVQLTIDASGQVTHWRLTKSSGNAVFDAAVQATLAQVTVVDPPPNGALVFNTNFRIPE